MYKSLHPRDEIDRLYVSRKEGSWGLASIEDSIAGSIREFDDYIKKEVRKTHDSNRKQKDSININGTTTRKKWEEKQLYGYFKR